MDGTMPTSEQVTEADLLDVIDVIGSLGTNYVEWGGIKYYDWESLKKAFIQEGERRIREKSTDWLYQQPDLLNINNPTC